MHRRLLGGNVSHIAYYTNIQRYIIQRDFVSFNVNLSRAK